MPTLQKPIGSGFGAASTAADVIEGIDLSGKIAIVTGGYSGIGVETSRALRSAGARVIVPARDHDKAANELKGIDVEIEEMGGHQRLVRDELATRRHGRRLLPQLRRRPASHRGDVIQPVWIDGAWRDAPRGRSANGRSPLEPERTAPGTRPIRAGMNAAVIHAKF